MSTYCQVHGLSVTFSPSQLPPEATQVFPFSFLRLGVFAEGDHAGFPSLERVREGLAGTAARLLGTAGAQKHSRAFAAEGPGSALPAPLTASQRRSWGNPLQSVFTSDGRLHVPQPRIQNTVCNHTTIG